MMDRPNQKIASSESLMHALMHALSTDCELHAQAAREKLRDVIERFRANDPLAAIGAFEGTTEIVLYMDAIVKRLAAIVRRS